MRIYRSVLDKIRNTLGSKYPEEGGILLTDDGGFTVTDFVYDDRGSRSGGTYTPNTQFINEQIRKHNNQGSYFKGVIHSHPRGYTCLSMGVGGGGSGYTASDEEAIYKLFGGMKGTKVLYFPVVQSAAGGGEFSMRVFRAERLRSGEIRITEDVLEVVDDNRKYEREIVSGMINTKGYAHNTAIFIDLRMSARAVTELARRGVSNFVLLDAEKFKDDDLGTIAEYSELGGYIADALAQRIMRINPAAQVRIIRHTVDADTEEDKFLMWLKGVNTARSIVWTYGDRPERFEYVKRLCSRARIAVMNAYFRNASTLYVDYYDYYAFNVPRLRKYYAATLTSFRTREGLLNDQAVVRISDFFDRPAVNKKQRREIVGKPEEETPFKFAGLYPKSTIEQKTVVIVGCGGSRSYAENMARSGVKRFVLIDGDSYSNTNLQTQMAFADELGANKAEALATDIYRICPDAEITVVPKMLDGKVSDGEFEYMVGSVLKERPHDVLIAACTDNFKAQARCSRLALKYGTPFIQAGIYQGGYILELVFFHPAVSHVCPRCMLEKRYAANLAAESKPAPAVSDGTSIFFTEELNAKKGYISLGLLLWHCPNVDRRYSEFLDDNMLVTRGGRHKTDRNFMFYTLCSDMVKSTGKRANAQFDKWGKRLGKNYQCGVSFFRERKPRKGCLDCGGSGDLSAVRGKIEDTRAGIYTKEEY